MVAYVKLTSSGGSAKTVLCNTCRVSWKNNNSSNPDANGTTVVSVQTQSFENPSYVLAGVHFTGGSGVLTYADLLSMAQTKYSGSNALTLQVRYGTSTDLVASDGVTTSIKVVVESFDFPIDVNDTKSGYMPIGTITLRETL